MQAFHLHFAHPVTRYQTTTRLYALKDEEMPVGRGMPQDLLSIAKYLDPENAPRYGKSITQNLLFAYDFCYLAGAYIPRIWWGDINNVEAPKLDMTTNALYGWFEQFGKDFGWKRVEDEKEAQELANVGHVVIIIASPINPRRQAIMTLVLPESSEYLTTVYMDKEAPHQVRSAKKHLKTAWYKSHLWREYSIYVNFIK